MNRLTIAILSVCLAPVWGGAAEKIDPLDNWPHWRGPLVNGTAPRGKPPTRWDAKTNLAWKTVLPGRGASTPIVWGDLVFVTTAVDTGKRADPKDIPKPNPRFANKKKTDAPDTYHRFIVLAVDRKSGKVRWQRTCAERVPHEGHHFTHNYAAGSPVTDGKRLYVSFGSFGVYCFDLAGKPLWQRDLGRMETRLGWGEASTPAVHGNRVFLTWDHEAGSFITALEADTGKPIWKVDRDEVTTWATPLVVEHKGKTQVIVPATNKVISYAADSGKVVWWTKGLTVNCIPSPVTRAGIVYCMSGYKGAAAIAVPLDAAGDAREKELWRLKSSTPYVPSPLLLGDRLYFNEYNLPVLSCVDIKTGKFVFEKSRLNRLGTLYASPVAAAGHIYVLDRTGTTMVLKPGDKPEVVAVNRLGTNTTGESFNASPAIAGKQLFLRSDRHLYCIAEK
jgi:outer membrane protein assembly factor BamB